MNALYYALAIGGGIVALYLVLAWFHGLAPFGCPGLDRSQLIEDEPVGFWQRMQMRRRRTNYCRRLRAFLQRRGTINTLQNGGTANLPGVVNLPQDVIDEVHAEFTGYVFGVNPVGAAGAVGNRFTVTVQ